MTENGMLLLQTAFDPEFKAVTAAGGSTCADRDGTLTIAGRTCRVLMTGMGMSAARSSLAASLDSTERPELVLSIGLAGGLHPSLSFGQSLLVDSVRTLDQPEGIASDLDRLSMNLRERMRVSDLLTLAAPALTASVKRQLGEQTGAAACDMETYAVADVCRQRQVRWIGARIISDDSSDTIPGWIVTLPRLIEQKKWLSLAGRVATHPQDFSCLIRLALRMQRLKPILTQLTIDLVQHVLST